MFFHSFYTLEIHILSPFFLIVLFVRYYSWGVFFFFFTKSYLLRYQILGAFHFCHIVLQLTFQILHLSVGNVQLVAGLFPVGCARGQIILQTSETSKVHT